MLLTVRICSFHVIFGFRLLTKVPKKLYESPQNTKVIRTFIVCDELTLFLLTGDGVPTVFIAVAGRSNGLGPVLAGNISSPVINCPPTSADFGTVDVWSSMRLPSGRQKLYHHCLKLSIYHPCTILGLTCSTVLGQETAALAAASILGLQDHVIWSRLRAKQHSNSISLLVNFNKA